MILSNKKTIVVIPAFNEEKTISNVIAGITSYVDQIVVVDDCSSDTTSQQATDAGAIVVAHEQNKGYDVSISDGFKKAKELGASIVVTFDADGQHNPEDLKKITNIIKEGKADVVAGQRLKLTHFAEKIFAFYTKIFFRIRDPLCGLKAYRIEAYDAVGHFDTVSSIGTQLMIEAIKKGFKPAFVPIHIQERQDTSRFYKKRLRANYKILRAMVRVMLFS